jgi:hypothetical protein
MADLLVMKTVRKRLDAYLVETHAPALEDGEKGTAPITGLERSIHYGSSTTAHSPRFQDIPDLVGRLSSFFETSFVLERREDAGDFSSGKFQWFPKFPAIRRWVESMGFSTPLLDDSAVIQHRLQLEDRG